MHGVLAGESTPTTAHPWEPKVRSQSSGEAEPALAGEALARGNLQSQSWAMYWAGRRPRLPAQSPSRDGHLNFLTEVVLSVP